MNIFNTLYETTLEALFPLSPIEKWFLNAETSAIIDSLPRAKNAPIPESNSVFSYKDERVRKLIWSIKYKKSVRSAQISATALYRFIQTFSHFVPQIIVIPIPISPRRRRERGFNQCELILHELKKIYSLKNEPQHEGYGKISFIDDLLIRSHHTSRQTLKDREHRLKSAHELFSVDQDKLKQLKNHKDPNDLNDMMNATFIIIDDVVTTGSTIREAISVVRNAGLKNTWGLSVAH